MQGKRGVGVRRNYSERFICILTINILYTVKDSGSKYGCIIHFIITIIKKRNEKKTNTIVRYRKYRMSRITI